MPDVLIVPGRLCYLGAVRAYVSDRAAAAGLDDNAVHQLVVAVDELVTNAIVHGYQEAGRDGAVSVRVESGNGQLRVVIEDESAPFDPAQEPPPADLHRPIQQRRAGGLGIYLARQCVDELRHLYVDGHNRNTLVVRLGCDQEEAHPCNQMR